MTTMQEKITRDSFRFAVGRQMFCPTCKRILDVRRAVELDFYRASPAGDSEIAGVKVLCTSCYDAKCAQGKLAAQLEGTAFTVEALDGRALFARGTKQNQEVTK